MAIFGIFVIIGGALPLLLVAYWIGLAPIVIGKIAVFLYVLIWGLLGTGFGIAIAWDNYLKPYLRKRRVGRPMKVHRLNVFVEYVKAKKHRICPLIRFVSEEDRL
jgi:dolichyl-phosphate-mannose--protein O-mannosyl transferase